MTFVATGLRNVQFPVSLWQRLSVPLGSFVGMCYLHKRGGHGVFLKDVFCVSKCQAVDMFSAQKSTVFLLFPGPLMSGPVFQRVFIECSVQNYGVPTRGAVGVATSKGDVFMITV